MRRLRADADDEQRSLAMTDQGERHLSDGGLPGQPNAEADRLMRRLQEYRRRGGNVEAMKAEHRHPRDLLEAIETQLNGWCGTPFQGRHATRG